MSQPSAQGDDKSSSVLIGRICWSLMVPESVGQECRVSRFDAYTMKQRDANEGGN